MPSQHKAFASFLLLHQLWTHPHVQCSEQQPKAPNKQTLCGRVSMCWDKRPDIKLPWGRDLSSTWGQEVSSRSWVYCSCQKHLNSCLSLNTSLTVHCSSLHFNSVTQCSQCVQGDDDDYEGVTGTGISMIEGCYVCIRHLMFLQNILTAGVFPKYKYCHVETRVCCCFDLSSSFQHCLDQLMPLRNQEKDG